MTDRKKKIEELLADFRSMRRSMALQSAGSGKSPRITPSQWGVLLHVEHTGKSTVKEVARALSVSSSASTQLVDGLVESGYLTRKASAEDRRTVMLTLSKKSVHKIETMKKQALQKFLKMFEVLNDKEFDQYLSLNKKIVGASSGKNNSL